MALSKDVKYILIFLATIISLRYTQQIAALVYQLNIELIASVSSALLDLSIPFPSQEWSSVQRVSILACARAQRLIVELGGHRGKGSIRGNVNVRRMKVGAS